MLKQSIRERTCSWLKVSVLFIWILPLSFACQKSEGPGGTASIAGTVYEQFYNDDFSLLIFEKPAVDEEIYIVYGDRKELGDRVRTNHLGQFQFSYLYPGNYQIFFISRDSAAVLDMEKEQLYEVDLERGEDLDLGRLDKLSTMDYDEGSARIKGVVKVIDYVDLSSWPNLVVEKTYYATEQEVYLTYNNHTFYDDRIRTQANGEFEFGGLIPGRYLVFLHSDDVTEETDKVTLEFEVQINQLDQEVDLGEIVIEKL